MFNFCRRLCLGAALIFAAAPGLLADESYELPPISYSATAPHDRVTAVQEQLASGKLQLTGDEKSVLRRLLKAFGIPESSQLLIFSKTSLQRDRIDPAHPRAIYFSDDVYVGWCPGGLAEVASIDPVLGPVFYRFDPRAAGATQRFMRDADCLRCHGGLFLREIPALLARSVYTDRMGEPLGILGAELVDVSTPFERRYGGWYVTGSSGAVHHLGNLVLSEARLPSSDELAKVHNLQTLEPLADTRPYLVDTSDLVALLVFEHQLSVQNVLTRANQKCLSLISYQQGVQRSMGQPVTTDPSLESIENAFADAVRQVMDALLSRNEAPLPEGGVRGVGGFAEAFVAQAAREGKPSLKELDLTRRLFKYRCSYQVQSAAFENMQPALRKRVLRWLSRVLSESGSDRRYAYLEPEERANIRRILLETVPGFR